MADRFEVEPAQLDRLAGRFEDEAAELGRVTSGFHDGVTHVEQAFGLLGPSDDLYHEYMGLARDCVRGLEQLQRSLAGTADGLATTARNYRHADASSDVRGGTVGGERP